MRRKGLGAIALSVLLTATMTACATTGEVSEKVVEKIVEKVVEVKVPIEYYDVTAVNGLIKDQTYNHEKVEKEKSVTVVAEATDGNKAFIGWYVGDDKVSEDLSYTFTPEANTVITAVYGTQFSVWSGEYPADAPEGFEEDTEEKTWHITSADGLAYWASKVTANADGTDPNASRYAAFSYADYARILKDYGGDDAPLETKRSVGAQCMREDNAWTLSLESNIDLGGYEWTPVNDAQWGLHGFTFDGNGYIIKNLNAKGMRVTTQKHKAGGFFGLICNDDFTVKNVTFTDALVVSDSDSAEISEQNLAVVIGFVNPNVRYTIYGNEQNVVFDNVKVYNSTVGDYLSCKQGFLVGRSGEYATLNDYVQYFFLNCDITGNTLVGQRIQGGLIGYAAHAGDSDISPLGEYLTINTYNTIVTNNTIISSYKNMTNGVYNFGSICSGDAATNLESYPNCSWGAIKYTENLKGMNNTLIDLHCGNGAVTTNAGRLRTLLEDTDEAGNYTNTAIIVVGNIDMSDVADMLDWEANTKQVIYLVAGAQITGLELGANVRYISGARNAEGKLIVTDKEGAELGVWEVAEDGSSGSFVAKATEPATEE